MVRVASQETFDEIVGDNITTLSMSREEAVEDAIQQLKAQGVNTSNLMTVQSHDENEGQESMSEKIVNLQKLLDDDDFTDDEKFQSLVISIGKDMNISLAHRVQATKLELYDTLIKAAKFNSKKFVIEALGYLLQENPDPLELMGFEIMYQLMQEGKELITLCLDVLVNGIYKHEHNKVMICENQQFLTFVSSLLDDDQKMDEIVIRKICDLWTSLVQDDDIRVPYGRAHDRAREIVERCEAIIKLIQVLKVRMKTEGLSNKTIQSILQCLTSIIVRNEYCQLAVDNNILYHINAILEMRKEGGDRKTDATTTVSTLPLKTIHTCLKVLKTIAGNDGVKVAICSHGFKEADDETETNDDTASLMFNFVEIVKSETQSGEMCKMSCDLMATLSLRQPENAEKLTSAGADQYFVEVLKIHSSKPRIVAACAWAIRNMVCRSNKLKSHFVDTMEMESLLKSTVDIHKHDTSCISALNGAMRDLGLQTVIKEEEWMTGAVKHDMKLVD